LGIAAKSDSFAIKQRQLLMTLFSNADYRVLSSIVSMKQADKWHNIGL